jgi:hypothetical protein
VLIIWVERVVEHVHQPLGKITWENGKTRRIGKDFQCPIQSVLLTLTKNGVILSNIGSYDFVLLTEVLFYKLPAFHLGLVPSSLLVE